MNAERFRTLVDAYGADPARWPADERRAMESFRDRHPEAPHWLRGAARLDALLDGDRVVTRDLSQRVLDAVPPTRLERFVAWLLPQPPTLWWRPAVAAALPMVLGILIGFQNPPAATDWAAEEKALLAVDTGAFWYE